jgi:excinuclease ABC subunit C
MQFPQAILEKIPHLPESPGVYLWRDEDGTVLYVGKAKRLRSRVRNYVGSDHLESVKTRALMRSAAALETIVVPSEAHALILEANLIKEYKPKYNIALRDDKSYPYIKVTVAEPFPRVWVTRHLQDDGSRYFGPYTDVGMMRRALNVVKRIFTVRSCNFDMPKQMPERPCLDYFIKRCKAPCILAQTQGEYRAMIDEVLVFLEGRTNEVKRRVRERMELAAESLDFERAAELRDALNHLEQMEEPVVVMNIEGGDRDVVGYARDGDDAAIALMRIRGGKLLAREHHFLANLDEEPDPAVLEAYLVGSYLPLEDRAAEVFVPFEPNERDLVETSLERTKVHTPQRGPRRELVDLATQNARHLLEEMRLTGEDTEERAGDPIYELQRQLGLQKVPRSLVCFDISHAQGTDTVASCVWFQNGRPYRAEYRKFKVKTVEGIDDFASMNEVVTRYFTRRIEDQKPFPDLVVVDGGKGQLNAAHAALSKLGLAEMPLISLAKRDEEIFVLGRSESLKLPRRSPALRVLQQARDEAHRFAITFQRKRRAARTITSELMRIPGVGEAKRRQLLQAFGSLQGVREASAESIAALPGFGQKSAARIIELLHASSPTAPTHAATYAPNAESNGAAPGAGLPTGEDELIAPAPAAPQTGAPELVQLTLPPASSSSPDAEAQTDLAVAPITPLPEHS